MVQMKVFTRILTVSTFLSDTSYFTRMNFRENLISQNRGSKNSCDFHELAKKLRIPKVLYTQVYIQVKRLVCVISAVKTVFQFMSNRIILIVY